MELDCKVLGQWLEHANVTVAMRRYGMTTPEPFEVRFIRDSKNMIGRGETLADAFDCAVKGYKREFGKLGG
jgi:hypothetical protein